MDPPILGGQGLLEAGGGSLSDMVKTTVLLNIEPEER